MKGGATYLTGDELLQQIDLQTSESQLRKEKEINVYKLFCDVIQSLDDREGNYLLSGVIHPTVEFPLMKSKL